MINGLFCLAAILTLAGTLKLLQNSRRANPDRQPTPIVMLTPRPCHVTGCRYPGTIPVTTRHGESERACAGHHAEGWLRGWWAA